MRPKLLYGGVCRRRWTWTWRDPLCCKRNIGRYVLCGNVLGGTSFHLALNFLLMHDVHCYLTGGDYIPICCRAWYPSSLQVMEEKSGAVLFYYIFWPNHSLQAQILQSLSNPISLNKNSGLDVMQGHPLYVTHFDQSTVHDCSSVFWQYSREALFQVTFLYNSLQIRVLAVEKRGVFGLQNKISSANSDSVCGWREGISSSIMSVTILKFYLRK